MAHICYHTKAQAEVVFLKTNHKSARVPIAQAESSIGGPNYVILFTVKTELKLISKKSSGNSYFSPKNCLTWSDKRADN